MSIENRLAAKKRSQQAKAKRTRNKILKIVGICLIPIIVCIIGYLIFMGVVEKNASPSAYLNADGTIDAKPAKNYVTLADYKNISVNREDYLPTETEVQTAIDTAMEKHVQTVTDAGTTYEKDSTVNLTFTVTVDGKELTDMAATNKEYILGTNTLSEAFDAKIAELTVGDEFTFDISYPSDFKTASLAGKTATFKGKVVSAKIVPELTDTFVSEKFKEDMEGTSYPLTAEGYKQYVANELFTAELEAYVDSYIIENTTVNKYPFLYLKNQYYLRDANYVGMVNYYNALFGQQMYTSPVEYLQLDSRSDYKKQLDAESKSTVAYFLTYQAIYEDAGLEAVTDQEIHDLIAEQEADYETYLEQYGYNYLAQLALKEKTFDYVMTLVNTTGDTSKLWTEVATGSDADAK